MSESEDAVRSGYLFRQTRGLFGTWTRGWYVLRSCYLYIYRSQSAADPDKIVSLAGAVVEAADGVGAAYNGPGFNIYTRKQKTYALSATDETDRTAWVEAIQAAIDAHASSKRNSATVGEDVDWSKWLDNFGVREATAAAPSSPELTGHGPRRAASSSSDRTSLEVAPRDSSMGPPPVRPRRGSSAKGKEHAEPRVVPLPPPPLPRTLRKDSVIDYSVHEAALALAAEMGEAALTAVVDAAPTTPTQAAYEARRRQKERQFAAYGQGLDSGSERAGLSDVDHTSTGSGSGATAYEPDDFLPNEADLLPRSYAQPGWDEFDPRDDPFDRDDAGETGDDRSPMRPRTSTSSGRLLRSASQATLLDVVEAQSDDEGPIFFTRDDYDSGLSSRDATPARALPADVLRLDDEPTAAPRSPATGNRQGTAGVAVPIGAAGREVTMEFGKERRVSLLRAADQSGFSSSPGRGRPRMASLDATSVHTTTTSVLESSDDSDAGRGSLHTAPLNETVTEPALPSPRSKVAGHAVEAAATKRVLLEASAGEPDTEDGGDGTDTTPSLSIERKAQLRNRPVPVPDASAAGSTTAGSSNATGAVSSDRSVDPRSNLARRLSSHSTARLLATPSTKKSTGFMDQLFGGMLSPLAANRKREQELRQQHMLLPVSDSGGDTPSGRGGTDRSTASSSAIAGAGASSAGAGASVSRTQDTASSYRGESSSSGDERDRDDILVPRLPDRPGLYTISRSHLRRLDDVDVLGQDHAPRRTSVIKKRSHHRKSHTSKRDRKEQTPRRSRSGRRKSGHSRRDGEPRKSRSGRRKSGDGQHRRRSKHKSKKAVAATSSDAGGASDVLVLAHSSEDEDAGRGVQAPVTRRRSRDDEAARGAAAAAEAKKIAQRLAEQKRVSVNESELSLDEMFPEHAANTDGVGVVAAAAGTTAETAAVAASQVGDAAATAADKATSPATGAAGAVAGVMSSLLGGVAAIASAALGIPDTGGAIDQAVEAVEAVQNQDTLPSVPMDDVETVPDHDDDDDEAVAVAKKAKGKGSKNNKGAWDKRRKSSAVAGELVKERPRRSKSKRKARDDSLDDGRVPHDKPSSRVKSHTELMMEMAALPAVPSEVDAAPDPTAAAAASAAATTIEPAVELTPVTSVPKTASTEATPPAQQQEQVSELDPSQIELIEPLTDSAAEDTPLRERPGEQDHQEDGLDQPGVLQLDFGVVHEAEMPAMAADERNVPEPLPETVTATAIATATANATTTASEAPAVSAQPRVRMAEDVAAEPEPTSRLFEEKVDFLAAATTPRKRHRNKTRVVLPPVIRYGQPLMQGSVPALPPGFYFAYGFPSFRRLKARPYNRQPGLLAAGRFMYGAPQHNGGVVPAAPFVYGMPRRDGVAGVFDQVASTVGGLFQRGQQQQQQQQQQQRSPPPRAGAASPPGGRGRGAVSPRGRFGASPRG